MSLLPHGADCPLPRPSITCIVSPQRRAPWQPPWTMTTTPTTAHLRRVVAFDTLHCLIYTRKVARYTQFRRFHRIAGKHKHREARKAQSRSNAMPTYSAIGVTASLATCHLDSTLTANILRTMGAECKKKHERVQKIFANARRLLERPIGENGGEKGVIRFVGADEDMPLFVVETGENIGAARGPDDEDADEEVPHTVTAGQGTQELASSASPLTSLGETPAHSSTPWPPMKNATAKQDETDSSSPPHAPSLAGHLAVLDDGSDKALLLTIDLSPNTFLPASRNNPKPLYKDLKIEIFLNGELVDVTFFSCRFANSTTNLRFSGTRVHRQVEKPWTYCRSSLSHSSSGNSSFRWKTISSTLSKEAERRGRNKYDRMPPSAEFLAALAELQFPQRLDGSDGLAILDVLITAGKGQKYGAETSYIMDPTRMDDSSYTLSPQPAFQLDESSTSGDNSMAEQTFESFLTQQSSPDVPLRHVHKVDSAPPSPPKKTRLELEAELGIGKNDKEKRLTSYETTSGRPGSRQRTLKQRLGDIGKMSPSNQASEMAKLKAEFGSEAGDTMKKKPKLDEVDSDSASPANNATRSLSRPEILVKDPFVDVPPDASLPAAAATDNVHTMSPTDMFTQWPQHIAQPYFPIDPALLANPDAVLAQSRIDMALDAGAPSNGPLLRRIAAASPVHTPPKKTSASALANSPAHVPVKPQKRPGPPKTPTPKRKHSILDRQDSPLSSMPDFTTPPAAGQTTPTKRAGTTTPSRSGRGADRTATVWDPHERTIAEAVNNFKSSAIFEASCVKYAEVAGAQRQIGKARAGRFQEESVVVGMRFVVL